MARKRSGIWFCAFLSMACGRGLSLDFSPHPQPQNGLDADGALEAAAFQRSADHDAQANDADASLPSDGTGDALEEIGEVGAGCFVNCDGPAPDYYVDANVDPGGDGSKQKP